MFKDIKILIVEDEHEIGALLRKSLEALTFEVETVASVSSGLDHLNADIMFLDWKLANGTGLVLLDRWTKENHGPLCIITGQDDDKEEGWMINGAWNILKKPFSMAVVGALAHRYAGIVLTRRIASEVKKLKRAILLLALINVALVGKEFIPFILGLL